MRGLQLKIAVLALTLLVISTPPATAQTQLGVKEVQRLHYYDMQGQEISSYLQKLDRKTLVMVFASWCGYCRQELPQVIRLMDGWDGYFVAISLDKDPKQLATYLRQYNLSRYVVLRATSDTRSPLASMGIKQGKGVPFYAMLDTNNTVIEQGRMGPSRISAAMSRMY